MDNNTGLISGDDARQWKLQEQRQQQKLTAENDSNGTAVTARRAEGEQQRDILSPFEWLKIKVRQR